MDSASEKNVGPNVGESVWQDELLRESDEEAECSDTCSLCGVLSESRWLPIGEGAPCGLRRYFRG